MEKIKFTQLARTDNEKIYLLKNSKTITVGTWQQIRERLPALDSDAMHQIINDIMVYGLCSFTVLDNSYQIHNNQSFYDYISLICNKDVVEIARYFRNINFDNLEE
jgi:hypothetical protein